MTRRAPQVMLLSMALALTLPPAKSSYAQTTPPPSTASDQKSSQQGGFVMKVNAELVLTNVVARDAKTGELVRGLKQSDFTIYENGKQQQIARSCSIAQSTVHEYLKAAAAAGVNWPLPADWDDRHLEETITGKSGPIEECSR